MEQAKINQQQSEQKITPPEGTTVHAIIAPHAGYSFSGSTAAYAYSNINTKKFSRIVILGPSHHVYLRNKCAVTNANILETPLGDLQVDRAVCDGLLDDHRALFVNMNEDMDEAEHSIEMHLPYIKYIFDNNDDIKVVPVVIGSLSEDREKDFGRILSTWFGDGETFFIISSDFCHWGTRFRYTNIYNNNNNNITTNTNNTNNNIKNGGMEIWQSIEELDKEGMSIIENGNHSEFCTYQRHTENTICGRHPIGVLMSALTYCSAYSNHIFTTCFVKYKQSSKCVKMSDSSVSYASALVYTSDSPSPPQSSSLHHHHQTHI